MKSIYIPQLLILTVLTLLCQAQNVNDTQCDNPERYEHSKDRTASYQNVFEDDSNIQPQKASLRDYETVFVVELIRHGARSHNKDNVPSEFFDGVEKSGLTRKGRIDQTRIGLARRNEYVNQKRFLSPDYNQHEILAISTNEPRCAESGEYFIRGLYPLQEVGFLEEAVHYEGHSSAAYTTMYQRTLRMTEERLNQCLAGPVIQIPFEKDYVVHSQSCQTLHDHINGFRYDKNLMRQKLEDEFGLESLQQIEDSLESHFLQNITDLKEYSRLNNAKISELYQSEHPDLRKFQRQECFILSHIFVASEPIHGLMFLSRILVPMHKLINNAKNLQLNNLPSSLKYLMITFHDTNLSNILRFIKYFETYGYKKYVMFSSSLRFELLKDKFALENSPHQYRIRIVFDNQELHLPFCQETYCTYEEYDKFFKDNLLFNQVRIRKYCKGQDKNSWRNQSI